MLIDQQRAPSYDVLRPFKATRTPGFPVYKDLVDDLVQGKNVTAPNWKIAHVLGTCAGYAYSKKPTVAMIMARMGMEDNYCAEIGEFVDAMFICSTAFLVQSRCGRSLILCYRGTEPANLINWLTDVDAQSETVPFALGNAGPFEVHAGFYRNVRATRYEVLNALKRALDREPIVEGAPRPEHALEALYITGHSLGGAMAALMGIMIATEKAYEPLAAKLKGIYTFGQPMVGSPKLAAACSEDPVLNRTFARFIYADDLVPALPPSFAGEFAHFGPEYQYAELKGARDWRKNARAMQPLSNPADLPLAFVSFLWRQVRRFRDVKSTYSMGDHGPQHYVAALTEKNGVPSEFGDEMPASVASPPAPIIPAARKQATAAAGKR
jgi:hypothetical protein